MAPKLAKRPYVVTRRGTRPRAKEPVIMITKGISPWVAVMWAAVGVFLLSRLG